MILIQAGLIHIFKCVSATLLTIAVTICLVLTYAYISGDRADREEMHQAAAHIGGYLRLVPNAEAQPAQSFEN